VSSCQRGVMIGEYSCGFAEHMNEDDEKLNILSPLRRRIRRAF
jgi:hypothetical protein